MSYSTSTDTYSIYADGSLLATATGTLTPGSLTSSSTAYASLGRVSSSATGFWAGRMSDFRAYNRLLTAAEIQTIGAMTTVSAQRTYELALSVTQVLKQCMCACMIIMSVGLFVQAPTTVPTMGKHGPHPHMPLSASQPAVPSTCSIRSGFALGRRALAGIAEHVADLSICLCRSEHTAPTRSDSGGCSALLSSIANGRYQDSSYVFCLGETYLGNNLYNVRLTRDTDMPIAWALPGAAIGPGWSSVTVGGCGALCLSRAPWALWRSAWG